MLKTIFGDDLGISPAVKSIFSVKTIKKGKKILAIGPGLPPSLVPVNITNRK